MAIAFSRTMRSLDADDLRGPRMVWVVAVILLAAWTWWFFAARIPVAGTAAASGVSTERMSPAKMAWRAIHQSPESSIPKDRNRQ